MDFGWFERLLSGGTAPFRFPASPDLFCILCVERDSVLARGKAGGDIPDK
jgi:hypothetical protein